MSTKGRKFILMVTVFVSIMSMLAACGTPATEAPAPATQAPAATQAPVVEDTKFTIGVSNPFISSEYRTQMIAELIEIKPPAPIKNEVADARAAKRAKKAGAK